MGYRYERFDYDTESWVRIKDTEIKKNMRVRIIDETETAIVEGRIKDLHREYIMEETNGIENATMDLNIEFDAPIPKEETVTEVFPSTSPPWQG